MCKKTYYDDINNKISRIFIKPIFKKGEKYEILNIYTYTTYGCTGLNSCITNVYHTKIYSVKSVNFDYDLLSEYFLIKKEERKIKLKNLIKLIKIRKLKLRQIDRQSKKLNL